MSWRLNALDVDPSNEHWPIGKENAARKIIEEMAMGEMCAGQGAIYYVSWRQKWI